MTILVEFRLSRERKRKKKKEKKKENMDYYKLKRIDDSIRLK